MVTDGLGINNPAHKIVLTGTKAETLKGRNIFSPFVGLIIASRT